MRRAMPLRVNPFTAWAAYQLLAPAPRAKKNLGEMDTALHYSPRHLAQSAKLGRNRRSAILYTCQSGRPVHPKLHSAVERWHQIHPSRPCQAG
jgi:hypothetical protein